MDGKGPYYRTVPSSPDEDGELSEPEGSGAAPAKTADTPKLTEDEELELRKKLLAKLPRKDKGQSKDKPKESSKKLSVEEDEMFSIQPGAQDSKRQEAQRAREQKESDSRTPRKEEREKPKERTERERDRDKERNRRRGSPEKRSPKDNRDKPPKAEPSKKSPTRRHVSEPREKEDAHRHKHRLEGHKHGHHRDRQRDRSSEKPDKRRIDSASSRSESGSERRQPAGKHPRIEPPSRDESRKRAERELKSQAVEVRKGDERKESTPKPEKWEKKPEKDRTKSPSPVVEKAKKERSSSPPKPAPQSDQSPPSDSSPSGALSEVSAPEVGDRKRDSDRSDSAKRDKYSKFESSPEPELSDEEMDTHDLYKEDDSNSEKNESDEEAETDLSVIIEKDWDELTEEEKAMLSPDSLKRKESEYQKELISQLPVYFPGISGCRNVAEFECLNRIEEGTFGVVYRALEKKTDEVVALKRLKMEKEREGFPITSLREINMLLKCGTHPNIVNVREIVVGSNMDKIYLVMEYVEHDMKSLMEFLKDKNKKFTIAQVKTLMMQLLSGCAHMHDLWVIHRDLKTSNLLFSHNGILKIGDFGLAREYGEPLKPYTPIVVTLWYRSPELLLGTPTYSTAIDMWSVGCIFAEFIKLKTLFPGRGEIDQLNKIFMEVGTPNETIWPGYGELPGVKKFAFANTPFNQLRKKFNPDLNSEQGLQLLNHLLAPCPERRISARDALKSEWFTEEPRPAPPEMFPTWPAKSEHHKKPPRSEPARIDPNEPQPSAEQLKLLSELKVDPKHASKGGFALKFDAPKF